jgi:hypothetical protein
VLSNNRLKNKQAKTEALKRTFFKASKKLLNGQLKFGSIKGDHTKAS